MWVGIGVGIGRQRFAQSSPDFGHQQWQLIVEQWQTINELWNS
jgi:hypothetical protein